MTVMSAVGNLPGRSTNSNDESILKGVSGDHHEACAHTLHDVEAPHKRAAAIPYLLGKINIDVMKERIELCVSKNF